MDGSQGLQAKSPYVPSGVVTKNSNYGFEKEIFSAKEGASVEVAELIWKDGGEERRGG